MSKETFIIRTEWYEAIAELDPIDQATILRNLFLYHIGDTTDVVLDTFGVKIVWKLIEPTLSRNIEAYDKKRDTSAENGKLGGRPESNITDLEGNKIPTKEIGKHYFYIIYDYDLNMYKIGETQDLHARRLSIKRPTKYLQVICFYTFESIIQAADCERECLLYFKEQRVKGDWLSLTPENLIELKQFAQNILDKYANYPNYPKKALSDSVYVSDYVSDSESVSVAEIPTPTPIEKLKHYPDQALTAPGTDTVTAHDQYYETEICHRHGFDIDTVRDIHTAWVGDRLGQMFTTREARQNFASYCAKWKQNNRNRGTPSAIPQKSNPVVNSSYLN